MAVGMSAVLDYLSVGNVLLGVVFLFFLYQLVELYSFRNMPPGPRFPVVPLLGHALQLDFKAENFADATKSFRCKGGGVFSFKLGKFNMVVAGNSESVKDVLVTRSADYAGRPQTFLNVEATLGGKDIVFGNYGPAWRLHRKLFTTALRQYLSNVQLIESRVCEQTQNLLDFLEEQKGKAFDPSDILAQSVANVICGITFGQGYDTSNPDMKQLLDLNRQIFSSTTDLQICLMLDLFSFSKYLPIPAYGRIIALNDKLFNVIRGQLSLRQDNFVSGGEICDLISGLIQAQKDANNLDVEERLVSLSDEYLMNTIQDMFTAGYETTSTTLTWAIAFLVNYPQFQTDIQRQLDEIVGRDRAPSLEDRDRLPLVHATIMEVLRLGNILPQALPHVALKDTQLCGYRVPKDTIVMVDTEAVHLDPNCWENASVFDPYRHIDKDGRLITNQGNFYPFGAGRRVCAGEPLAKVELFLFLSWMLHRFTFVADNILGTPVLEGVVGITNIPKPYKIRGLKR